MKYFMSGVSAFALAVLIAAGTTAPVSAFQCDGAATGVPAAGSNGADDNGSNSNIACGGSSNAGEDAVLDDFASAFGFNADAEAVDSVAVGAHSQVDVDSTGGIAIGRNATVSDDAFGGTDGADFGVAIGYSARAGEEAAVAIGQQATASGERSIAIGRSSVASGDRSTAMGTNSTASGDSSTAIGRNTTASHTNSTAIGAFATTTNTNQVALGTAGDTLYAPGITSQLSKDRQSGPLEVLTTDLSGNLASDGGYIYDSLDTAFESIDEAKDGAAVAAAMENPDLTGDEMFGVALNYGNFDGSSAVAGSVMGVLWSDGTRRIAVSGGIGYGFETETLGTRVGGQLTW